MIPTNGFFVVVPVAITWSLSTTVTAFTITVPSSSSLSLSQSSSLSRHFSNQRNNNHRTTSYDSLSLDWSSYRSSNKGTRRLRRRRTSSKTSATTTQLSLALLPELHFLLSSASEVVSATTTNSELQSNSILHIPNLIQVYGSLLKDYPITTKCTTASTLGCLGDFIAQFGAYIQQQKNNQQEEEQQRKQQQQVHVQQQQQSTITSSMNRDSNINININNNNSNNEIQSSTIIDHETQTLQRIADLQIQNNKNNNSIQFQYDIERGIAFFLFGAFYTGAFQHVWFEYLSNHVSIWGQELGIWDQSARAGTFSTALAAIADGTRAHEWFTCFDMKLHMDLPPSPLAIATAKVMINQFFMVPSLYMPLFFLVTGYIADLNAQQSAERCRSLYFPLLFRNYVFWLPVQLIQFLFVPVQWQIPVQSVASLVWTVILSSIGSSSANSNKSQEQQQQQLPSLVSPAQSIEIGELVDGSLSLPETVLIAAGGLSSSNLLLTNDGDDAVTEITQLNDNTENENMKNNIPTPIVLDYTMNSKLDIFDEVTVKDVISEPIFESAQKLLVDQKIGAAGSGFALGLLSAATDEASLGTAIGALLGGETDLGVAVLSALGAGASILAANALDKTNTNSISNNGSSSTTNETTTVLESETTVTVDSILTIYDVLTNNDDPEVITSNTNSTSGGDHLRNGYDNTSSAHNSESPPSTVDNYLSPIITSSSTTSPTTRIINDDLPSIDNDIIINDNNIRNFDEVTINSKDSRIEPTNHDIVTLCQHDLVSNEELPCINNCKDVSTTNNIKLTTTTVSASVQDSE